MSRASGRTIEVDGIAIRVDESGTPGRSTPLLLINGIGADLGLWGRLPQRLARDRRVITFDAPGSGRSGDLAYPLRMPQLARLVTALLARLGQPRVDVLGYSWGGTLAQQLARTSPLGVRRLVLVSTTPGLGGRLPALPARLAMAPPAFLLSERYARAVASSVYGGGPAAASVRRRVVRHLHERRRPYGYACQTFAIATWTSLPWLARITAPTLVIGGDDDPLVPIDNARLLAAGIPGAELRVQRGAGHLWLLDRPEESAVLIERFLGASASGRRRVVGQGVRSRT